MKCNVDTEKHTQKSQESGVEKRNADSTRTTRTSLSTRQVNTTATKNLALNAEQEELGYFLSVLETKKKNEGVKRPALITLDDKEVQKMRTVAYRFICLNVKPRDYAQVEGFIHEALEKLER